MLDVEELEDVAELEVLAPDEEGDVVATAPLVVLVAVLVEEVLPLAAEVVVVDLAC